MSVEQLAKMYEVFSSLSSDALRLKDRMEFLEPGFLERQKRLEEEWHRYKGDERIMMVFHSHKMVIATTLFSHLLSLFS